MAEMATRKGRRCNLTTTTPTAPAMRSTTPSPTTSTPSRPARRRTWKAFLAQHPAEAEELRGLIETLQLLRAAREREVEEAVASMPPVHVGAAWESFQARLLDPDVARIQRLQEAHAGLSFPELRDRTSVNWHCLWCGETANDPALTIGLTLPCRRCGAGYTLMLGYPEPQGEDERVTLDHDALRDNDGQVRPASLVWRRPAGELPPWWSV
jgi:hypothetical protein